jgi:hypothetical protein
MLLQLVGVASNTADDQDWMRRCIPHFYINFNDTCAVNITPEFDMSDVKVPDIWSTNPSTSPDAFTAVTQPRTPRTCPDAAGGAVVTPATVDAAGIEAAIEEALADYVYAGGITLPVAFTWSNPGVVTIETAALGNFPSSGALKYAIPDVSGCQRCVAVELQAAPASLAV